jgi:hypothetical protein
VAGTGQFPKQRVDLDLDALAPPPRTFSLDGKVYSLPGEIPIPDVVAAMQMQKRLEEVDEMIQVPDEELDLAAVGNLVGEITGELTALVEKLVGQELPATLTIRQLFGVVGLVMSGRSVQPQEAVLDTLRQKKDENGKTSLPPTRPTAAKTTRKKSPSRAAGRSTKPSRARSSG